MKQKNKGPTRRKWSKPCKTSKSLFSKTWSTKLLLSGRIDHFQQDRPYLLNSKHVDGLNLETWFEVWKSDALGWSCVRWKILDSSTCGNCILTCGHCLYVNWIESHMRSLLPILGDRTPQWYRTQRRVCWNEVFSNAMRRGATFAPHDRGRNVAQLYIYQQINMFHTSPAMILRVVRGTLLSYEGLWANENSGGTSFNLDIVRLSCKHQPQDVPAVEKSD